MKIRHLLHSSSSSSAAAAKSLQSCPTLCDPLDSSPPGSPVPGILQARTLEWVAIAFSNVWKWKVKVKLLSRVRLFETPWTAACQAPPWDFPGKSTGVGCHCLLRFILLSTVKTPLDITIYKISKERLGKVERRQTVSGPQNPKNSIVVDSLGFLLTSFVLVCVLEKPAIQKSQFPIFVSKDWVKSPDFYPCQAVTKCSCWDGVGGDHVGAHLHLVCEDSFPSSLRWCQRTPNGEWRPSAPLSINEPHGEQ